MLVARANRPAPSPPITRDSLLWLFAIQVFVLVPHFLQVATWIPLVWCAVVFWRWKIFQGAWNYPNKLHKTIMVLICAAGLLLSLGMSFSLTAMLSLLLVGSILKLLEIKTRKDFVLLIFLSLFILATQFIFFNHVLAAGYGFFCLLLLCAALRQLYQVTPAKNIWERLRPTLFILLQALPIMAMLFVVVPRLGAFWSVPAPLHAKTGMSDSMSPGDFSKLVQSNELAFRVVFDPAGDPAAGDPAAGDPAAGDPAAGDPAAAPSGSVREQSRPAILSNEMLYWRSLVFANFDGRRWSQAYLARSELQSSAQAMTGWREKIDYQGEQLSYEIIAEPSGKTWLYSLAVPQRWSGELLLGPDLNLTSKLPVSQRISYKVTSALSYSDASAPANLQKNLQLPQWSNPQTQRIAKQWLAEAGTAEKLIEKLFAYYRSDFFYTLTPPALSNDSIDQFLWQSRQGFCEHFAGSFVFFMRAAGIPARVVVGYQGGTLNPAENYLSIYQRDAHAWAEVWIEGRGWRRYDPTGAVAPERIRRGISESLSATDRNYLGSSFTTSFTIFNTIQQRWDALNFQWLRWVMNYDSDLQSGLLTRLINNTTPWRIVTLLLGTVLLTALSILLLLFFRTRRKPLPAEQRAAQSAYSQLCKKLQPCGFAPASGETPGDFVARVIAARPDLEPTLTAINKSYEQLVYAENAAVLPGLQRQLRHFSVKNRKMPS